MCKYTSKHSDERLDKHMRKRDPSHSDSRMHTVEYILLCASSQSKNPPCNTVYEHFRTHHADKGCGVTAYADGSGGVDLYVLKPVPCERRHELIAVEGACCSAEHVLILVAPRPRRIDAIAFSSWRYFVSINICCCVFNVSLSKVQKHFSRERGCIVSIFYVFQCVRCDIINGSKSDNLPG